MTTHSLLYPRRPAQDMQWFKQIKPYIDELYITLGVLHPRLAELERAFNHEPFNPDLRPLHLEADTFKRRNRELAVLKSRLEDQEANTATLRAYQLKIDELTAQNQLLMAAIRGDKPEAVRLNRWLFGTADPKLFAGACSWIRQVATDEAASHNTHLSQAATAVLRTLPDVRGEVSHITPDSHIFKRVRDAHFKPGGYFDALLGNRHIPEVVTASNSDTITASTIRNVGSGYLLADSTDYLWGVIHDNHSVVRPADFELSKAGYIGIISHEIGSHLLERENGNRQMLRLLSVGLDRYEVSNEGRAFLREQIQFHSPYEMMAEPSWEHIILLYISSALGDGIFHHPYDFVTLHQTVYAICRLFQARRMPDNPVMAEQRAREEAWQLSTRAAKGTDGTGGAFNKGMVYLSGNLQAWLLAAIDPNIIFLGDAGKFDISRPDHRDILAAYDIILPG